MNERSTDLLVPLQEKAGDVAKSLEDMIKSQYTSRDFNDIFAATEFTRREVFALANGASNRYIMMILSTEQKDIDVTKDEKRKEELRERLELKKRIKETPTALSYAMWDSFMYFYGLAKVSLERKSRAEAVKIATARMHAYAEGKDMSRLDRLRGRLLGGDRVLYRTGEQ